MVHVAGHIKSSKQRKTPKQQDINAIKSNRHTDVISILQIIHSASKLSNTLPYIDLRCLSTVLGITHQSNK